MSNFPRLKNKPIDSYTQVIMLFVWTIGGATILVILTGIEIKTFSLYGYSLFIGI